MENNIEQDKKLIELAGCIPNVRAQVDRLIIDSAPAQSTATALLKTLKEMKKDVDERKEFYTKPLNKILKFARERAKELTAPLLEMETKLRAGLVTYQEYLEKVKAEAEAKQAKEAADKQAEIDRANKKAEKAESFDDMVKAEGEIEKAEEKKLTVAPEVRNTVRGGGGSVSYRKIWQHEVIDIEKIPRGFLSVDTVAIGDAIKKGVRDIPGVRIYEKTITSVR